jgi:hypothetical protein
MTTTTQTTVKLVAAGTIRNGKVTLRTDPEFAPAVTVIDNDPALATPFQIGVMDAEDGELCLPELYYVKAQDKYDYALGYNSIRPSILASQIMDYFETCQYAMAKLEHDDTHDQTTMWQG